ncbi:MAG: hypothetical protein BWK80_46365 [Desulfobacteraceae bacterium IS3]|nr:MAG: hypothetical protein BWK80_46365 [Desulfobacteraceae bacterium IS3]
MIPQPERKFISHKDYLEMEEQAEYKSEYYHGEIFAMTGASHNHNLITGNVFASLRYLLRETGDMKIQIDPARHYAYPDVSVVCGEIEFAENRNDIIANPVVIIEVLSESTRDYDRGSKFKAYRNIGTLRDYILIDQYACHIEHFFKNKSGIRESEEFDRLSDVFALSSVDATLSLEAVYYRVRGI